MSKWHRRFLDLAGSVASWSKDPSTKVGAVLVSPDRGLVIPGYNGLPRGVDDDPHRFQDREWKLATVLHAELNAILTARQNVSGWVMYVTHHPCSNCASVMIQSGISCVHYRTDRDFENRWAVSLGRAKDLLAEAGVLLEGYA